jgi:hypothetical protein
MRTSSARHAQRLEVQLQTDGAIPLFSRRLSGSHVKNTNTITIFRQPSQGTFVARIPIVGRTWPIQPSPGYEQRLHHAI